MTADPYELWVYLSRTPLLWLTLTLAAYALADHFSILCRRNPLANPVLHAVWMLGLLLVVTNTSYADFFNGAQFVHFLLGPATVALALPLYQNRARVFRALVPMAAALFAGSLAAILSVIACSYVFDLPKLVLISSLPKSTTSGVAMGISQSTGGDASLTAIIVVATGIVGAVIASPLLNAMRVTDKRARGFSLGLAAHGVGTARAFQEHSLTGTFAGIAMGLNGILTAVLVPLVLAFFGF
jgi:predicted murein hydrolase (TIGR00659 family)